MKRIFAFILPLVFLVSCYHDQEEETRFDMDKVMSSKKMIELFTDIQLLDGVVILEQRENKDPKRLANEMFPDILEKHEVSREEFDESMRYYTYHTEKLNKIYEKVITNLSKMESEISLAKEPQDGSGDEPGNEPQDGSGDESRNK